MKPIDQDKLAAEGSLRLGNCFAACLASLLELPLWAVPAFEDARRGESMHYKADKWLRLLRLGRLVRTMEHQSDIAPFYIACGVSPRGVHHAVVYANGQLVHDPHFSRAGITEVEFTYHVEPLITGTEPEAWR